MSKKFRIPSTGALVAFESAGRLLSFSRAAEELHIAQSAVSRYISELEKRLNMRLFIRADSSRHGVKLSYQGEQLYRYVELALINLQTGINAMQSISGGNELVIGCSHEISHLYVMPKYEGLQSAIGEDVHIRLSTSDFGFMEKPFDPNLDIIFVYKNLYEDNNRFTVIYEEGIKPVCSPQYFNSNSETLLSGSDSWKDITFLRLSRFSPGWATWEDWFKQKEPIGFKPKYVDFDNYVYLLEAAAAGRGLALGWRGLIERYLDSKSLIDIDQGFVNLDRKLYAVKTDKGQRNPASDLCLSFFGKQLSLL